ncbi:hypothetical protein B0T19DRAFT_159296 [Cercophora scortea]|uniref:Uncharacterized protein n=1 Tax=Cercophora scortea TaxID=314031 RepID=A0AAE0MDR1_9PEZI|nr:hypothetical protein B0T19DRAFT_159296 [Cercophora scortea]
MVDGRMRAPQHELFFPMDGGFFLFLPGRMDGFGSDFRGASLARLTLWESWNAGHADGGVFIQLESHLLWQGKSFGLGLLFSFGGTLQSTVFLLLAYVCAYTPWSCPSPCAGCCLPWACTHMTRQSRPHGDLGDQWPNWGWLSDWEGKTRQQRLDIGSLQGSSVS